MSAPTAPAAPAKPGPRRNRGACIIARWRRALSEENQDTFDTLLDRVRDGELAAQSLWRSLYARGLDASAASFDRHLHGICTCRHNATSGETL